MAQPSRQYGYLSSVPQWHHLVPFPGPHCHSICRAHRGAIQMMPLPTDSDTAPKPQSPVSIPPSHFSSDNSFVLLLSFGHSLHPSSCRWSFCFYSISRLAFSGADADTAGCRRVRAPVLSNPSGARASLLSMRLAVTWL